MRRLAYAEPALRAAACCRNTYSALNALAGHYNSFGTSAPVPKKRLERLVKACPMHACAACACLPAELMHVHVPHPDAGRSHASSICHTCTLECCVKHSLTACT